MLRHSMYLNISKFENRIAFGAIVSWACASSDLSTLRTARRILRCQFGSCALHNFTLVYPRHTIEHNIRISIRRFMFEPGNIPVTDAFKADCESDLRLECLGAFSEENASRHFRYNDANLIRFDQSAWPMGTENTSLCLHTIEMIYAPTTFTPGVGKGTSKHLDHHCIDELDTFRWDPKKLADTIFLWQVVTILRLFMSE